MYAILDNGHLYETQEAIEEHTRAVRSETRALFLNGNHADFETDQWYTIGVEFPRSRQTKWGLSWAVPSTELCKKENCFSKKLWPNTLAISPKLVEQITRENFWSVSNCVLFDYMLWQREAAILRQPLGRNTSARIWIMRSSSRDPICEEAFKRVIADRIVQVIPLQDQTEGIACA